MDKFEGVRSSKLNSVFLEARFVNNPPKAPTGATKIDTSMHDGDVVVEPVQRHFPSMHAPFLLQWYAHDFLFLQWFSNLEGQVSVP